MIQVIAESSPSITFITEMRGRPAQGTSLHNDELGENMLHSYMACLASCVFSKRIIDCLLILL